MRWIRGYIKNLVDGGNPVADSVNVSAEVGGVEINNTTHKTGTLTLAHVASGSATKADANGLFGWGVQLSPGAIEVDINPTTPSTEHRKRFYDESAQIGLAFMSDIERFGWMSGDGIVWGYVPSQEPAAAGWSSDPTDANSYTKGDFGIAAFVAANRQVTLRQGLAFVGGQVFSIESANLTVPVAGETQPSANASGSQRWDLLYARTNLSTGAQSFQIVEGSASDTILPSSPGQLAGYRRLPLFLLKLAAGADTYSAAIDLRRWLNHPANSQIIQATYEQTTATLQSVSSSTPADSALNATMVSAGDIILPLGSAWMGHATYYAYGFPGDVLSASGTERRLFASLITEGRSVLGEASAIAGSDFATNPSNSGDGYPAGHEALWALSNTSSVTARYDQAVAFTFPIRYIPSFALDSALNVATRSWHKLRMRVQLANTPTGSSNRISLRRQRLHVMLWPVR